MSSLFEALPNEILLYEIFRYLTFVDLQYAFLMLNQRFKQLLCTFQRKRIHYLEITSQISRQQISFLIDHVLLHLEANQRLKRIEINHRDLGMILLSNLSQINTIYLEKISINQYVDISFDSIMQCVASSSQLKECRLKVLTNIDTTWANGRKWIRWFELLKKMSRDQTLEHLHVLVWCINRTDASHFDRHFWNPDGSFKQNPSWKVQLQPQDDLFTPSRRTVEYSVTNHDFSSTLQNRTSDCRPS